MPEEIRMKFGKSEVVYNVRNQTWTIEGVSEATLLKVAPEKAVAINAALAKEVAEYQERIAKKEAEEKDQITAKKQAIIDAFKVQVEPLLPAGFTAEFAVADYPYSSIILSDLQRVHIQRDTVKTTVRFEDRVYGGKGYGFSGHTTSSPWLVEFNYKNSRFATLDKAIKSACKKINEEIAEQARKKAVQEVAQKVKQDQAAYLAEQGIQMVIETKYEEGRRGRNGFSYEVKKARIVVSDPAPEDKYSKKVVVSGNLMNANNSYEVHHLIISGSFTLEQFKKLADAVKEIAPESASDY